MTIEKTQLQKLIEILEQAHLDGARHVFVNGGNIEGLIVSRFSTNKLYVNLNERIEDEDIENHTFPGEYVRAYDGQLDPIELATRY